MKKKSLTPQEEYTGQAPELNRKTRTRKISSKAWIAAVLSLIMSLSLIGLYYLSFMGTGKNGKIVLFYCDKRFFPYVSMRNTLASAGFDMAVVEPDTDDVLSSSRRYSIPAQYKGRQVVVVSFGKDAFKVMDDIKKENYENVIGYCLVSPGYPGNAALEGYGRRSPNVPVAIFSFASEQESADKEGGTSMLYEKLSGADTLYGVPATYGTIVKNKIYITPDQNRYLSVSPLSLGAHVIRYSPLFENELGSYLGITFDSGYSSFRVRAWFICSLFAAFAALGFFSLFVFNIPVRDSDKGSKELKGRDSLGAILFFGLSAWTGLTISVMTYVQEVEGYARYAVVMTPAVLTALMALMRLPFLLSKKMVYKRDKLQSDAVLVPMVMALCEIILVIGAILVFTDITAVEQDSIKLAAALSVFIVSSLSALTLARADRKSRFVGEGPASYFGNPVYFIETIIPAVALLFVSILRGYGSEICYASMALACGIIPFAASVTIKRFSDFFEATGVVFGTLMAILVYIAL